MVRRRLACEFAGIGAPDELARTLPPKLRPMNARVRKLLRSPQLVRAAVRAAIVLPVVLGGCISGGGGGSCSSGGGGCEGPGDSALSEGSFTYVCATPDRDTYCADAGAASSAFGDLPTVAVGATFSLSYTDNLPDEAGSTLVRAPVPAVPSLTTSTPAGVALLHPGWYAFLAVEPGAVRDFINVQAATVDKLVLTPSLSGTTLAAGGEPFLENVSPLAKDGTVLAGALDCAFQSSNADVIVVAGGGRQASVQAVGVGHAVLTVSCLGLSSETTVAVTLPYDGGQGDGGPDARVGDGAAEAGNEGDGEAEGGDADAALEDGNTDAGTDPDAGEGG
jgi:hypothetical protein